MNKKILVIGMFLLIGIFLINFISSENLYCCEKTKKGAWCQNAPVGDCAPGYEKTPTSCEATTYCKLGTCYNSIDGTCLPNVPKRNCQQNGSIWHEQEMGGVPQCQLGCCLLGEQAVFVTQTRCKSLSSMYGLETNFRTDIGSEVQCLMSANPKVKGACVFERDYERTCKFLTKEECLAMQTNSEDVGGFFGFGGNDNEEFDVQFHEGYLCSAPTLGTNCGPSKKTTCVEGRDEVYFVDTCGNLANIYWADKINDENDYWTYVKDYTESCDVVTVDSRGNPTNADRCGNCDYYSGTTCKPETRTETADIGDYVCKNLGCSEGELAEEFKEKNGRYPNHGEIWCTSTGGASEIKINNLTQLIEDAVYTYSNEDCYEEYKKAGFKVELINPNSDCANLRKLHLEIVSTQNLPGSRYFRLACYNNEVTVEPCADYRQEVCIESEVNGFSSAACRVNQWEDCGAQTNKEDCENTEERDCMWIFVGMIGSDSEKHSVCTPRYAPGFDFWNEKSETENFCALANDVCVTQEEAGLDGSYSCKENCDCLKPGTAGATGGEWLDEKIAFCQSLGDCGYKVNYIETEGDIGKYEGFYGKSFTPGR